MITRIQYLEKPASPDEEAIARVIELFLEGHKQDNREALGRFLADSAVVEVAAGRKRLAKNEFLEYSMRNNPTVRQFHYWDVLIRLKSSAEALVSYTCRRQHRGSVAFHITRRIFVLAKNPTDRQWYIASSVCAN